MNWSSSATSRKLIWRKRIGDVDAGVGQQPQVVDRRGDRTGQLPGRVGAAVVERRAVDGDRPHTAAVPASPAATATTSSTAGAARPLSRRGQRVGTQVDRQHARAGVVRAGHQGQQRLGRGREVARRRRASPAPGRGRHPRAAVEVGRPRHPSAPTRSTSALTPVGQRVEHRAVAVGDGAAEPGAGNASATFHPRQDVAVRRHRRGRTASRRAAAARAARRVRCRAGGSGSPRRSASRAAARARRRRSAGSRRLLLASTPATAERQRARSCSRAPLLDCGHRQLLLSHCSPWLTRHLPLRLNDGRPRACPAVRSRAAALASRRGQLTACP